MTYWWERLKIKSDAKNVSDFMKERNFSINIESFPVYANINEEYIKIPNYQVCVKNGKPLFAIKSRFKLLSNEFCFNVCDMFKQKYKSCKFVSCGNILKDTKAYITLLINEINICNDDFLVYVTVTNGFDGRTAINCILTLVRKKDNCVLQLDNDSNKRIWTMSRLNPSKHFNSMIQEIESYLIFIKNECEALNEKEIQLNEIINPLFSLDWKKTKTINKHIAEEKENIRDFYLKNHGKNLYDLYFAISYYYCNHKLKRTGKLGDDVRFDFAMCGYFHKLHNYGKYLQKIIN